MARRTKNIIEYRIYELEPSKPFLCLSGEEWRISDVLSDRLHFHNCLEIGYCHSDSGFIGFENGMHVPFASGDIFLIPRFVPHTTCSNPGCRSRWSYLFIDPYAYGRPENPRSQEQSDGFTKIIGSYLHITEKSHPRLYFVCKCLLEEARGNAGQNLRLFSLYTMLLEAELSGMHSEQRPKGAALSRSFILKPALEYINSHYMEACNVEKLANICHLSQTHFRRMFLSIMGATPLQYVIQIRIRQACILLNTTNEPITSIAQSVGISSISSFNRNFQQVMKISPHQYRQSSKPVPARQRQYILPYKGWMVPENL